MSILLVGLSHRTAPVELREQLAFTRDGVGTALMLFHSRFPGTEVALVSTCNRVELLVAAEGERPTVQDVVSFLAQARDLPAAAFKPHLYHFRDEQACRHVFRVASGLDSMVLGESQIVSQMKQAYALASEQGTTGRVLNRIFHHAFEVSKRVRTETDIAQGKLSVPAAAVDVARQVFSDFATKQTLVVGAGEMAQLVCQYLREADARKFVVTTRTLNNARALAEVFQGTAVPFDELDARLVEADIVITAMAGTRPLLTFERLREAQRRRRGRLLFVIDLAVPRNVAAEAGRLEQVYLYDIDALGQMVAQNQERRASQLTACETILDQEVAAFEQWLGDLRLNPIIAQMFKEAREVRDAELERLLRRCPELSDEQRKAVTELVDRLVGKFMHPCVATLRQQGRPAPAEPAPPERGAGGYGGGTGGGLWSALSQALHAAARREDGRTGGA